MIVCAWASAWAFLCSKTLFYNSTIKNLYRITKGFTFTTSKEVILPIESTTKINFRMKFSDLPNGSAFTLYAFSGDPIRLVKDENSEGYGNCKILTGGRELINEDANCRDIRFPEDIQVETVNFESGDLRYTGGYIETKSGEFAWVYIRERGGFDVKKTDILLAAAHSAAERANSDRISNEVDKILLAKLGAVDALITNRSLFDDDQTVSWRISPSGIAYRDETLRLCKLKQRLLKMLEL